MQSELYGLLVQEVGQKYTSKDREGGMRTAISCEIEDLSPEKPDTEENEYISYG